MSYIIKINNNSKQFTRLDNRKIAQRSRFLIKLISPFSKSLLKQTLMFYMTRVSVLNEKNGNYKKKKIEAEKE